MHGEAEWARPGRERVELGVGVVLARDEQVGERRLLAARGGQGGQGGLERGAERGERRRVRHQAGADGLGARMHAQGQAAVRQLGEGPPQARAVRRAARGRQADRDPSAAHRVDERGDGGGVVERLPDAAHGDAAERPRVD
jgi:hypothetical protein